MLADILHSSTPGGLGLTGHAEHHRWEDLQITQHPIIGPDKARKGVIYPLKTGIYALVEISERTFTRSNF